MQRLRAHFECDARVDSHTTSTVGRSVLHLVSGPHEVTSERWGSSLFTRVGSSALYFGGGGVLLLVGVVTVPALSRSPIGSNYQSPGSSRLLRAGDDVVETLRAQRRG